MSAAATPAIAILDAWEALRAHVLNGSREAAARAQRRAAGDWRALPPRDRAAVAIAVILSLDPANPAARRHARQILADIQVESPGAVREDPPPGFHDLPEKKRDTLRHAARAVMDQAFAARLEAAAGPVAAEQLVARAVPGLAGPRAARFLAEAGYPVAVVDKPRLRWLHRFGLAESAKDTRATREEGLRQIAGLAQRVGATLPEVDVVLGAFTGADPAEDGIALCGKKPRCRACPLRAHCRYARFVESHAELVREDEGAATSRKLADAVLPEDRPREKLARLGPEALSNAELLAILLRTGNGKEHAVELAARILREAGSIDRLAQASVASLTRTRGLGAVKAITIKAALELSRRLAESRPPGEALTSSRQIYERLRGFFLDRRKELFLCLALDTKHRLLRQIVVSEGIVNQSLVHPREAFGEAIKDSAYAVVFAHNHPSGDPAPSADDRRITTRLVQAGEIVGIRVVDHVIVGRDSYFSFADEGLL